MNKCGSESSSFDWLMYKLMFLFFVLALLWPIVMVLLKLTEYYIFISLGLMAIGIFLDIFGFLLKKPKEYRPKIQNKKHIVLRKDQKKKAKKWLKKVAKESFADKPKQQYESVLEKPSVLNYHKGWSCFYCGKEHTKGEEHCTSCESEKRR